VRALVTGGAGFIGSTLTDRLLAEGWSVDVVDDLSAGSLTNLADARAQQSRKFSFHRLDVRSPAITDLIVHRKPDVVFHLAAQADVRVSVNRPTFDAEVNILGTLNVCQGAVAARTGKVVFASSGGTIYGTPEEIPVKESHPQRPESPYGVAKKAAGDYLHYYRQIHGLEYTALAFSNVYGPRQDPHGEAGVVAIFGGMMLERRRPTVFGDGNQTRDFVFIDDVAHAFVQAMDRGSGKLVNIGTGLETSVAGLYKLLAGIVGFTEEPGHAALPPGELRRIALDISVASKALAWKPWTHLEDGLAETVAYLKGI